MSAMYTTMPEGSDVPLTTTQLRQALLPHATELDLDLQTRRVVHVLRRHELGKVPREQLAEDATEVLVDLLPSLAKGVALLLVELLNGVLDLGLIFDDAVDLLEGLGFALLDAADGGLSDGQRRENGEVTHVSSSIRSFGAILFVFVFSCSSILFVSSAISLTFEKS